MALADDLIITARQLAHLHERRPRQADLRRAISTAYYATFHGLAEVAASRLIGTSTASQKTAAWTRVYRALNHQAIKKACGHKEVQNYSEDLATFINLFPELQELRQRADYDPNARYKHGEVLSAVNDAEVA
ncbi:MAG: hypothetical protein EBS77_09845, partial [Gammaproteobacteria bacterium]|nr:hypothetical protein [Gammaproteobacteria bacterium]